MKHRMKALVLALGLGVSSLSMSVYAEEEADASDQILNEAQEEAALEENEADLAASDEGEDQAGPEGEIGAETVNEETVISEEDIYKEMMENYLVQISDWTNEQVEVYMESEDNATALIALNWNTVMSELGEFEEVLEITDVVTADDGLSVSVTGLAEYSGVGDDGTVTVTMENDYVYYSTYGQYMPMLTDIEWQVDYKMGVMFQKAALNTLMGICIVFLGLAFLSFLISRIRYVPALFGSGKKKKEEEEAAGGEPEAAGSEVSAAAGVAETAADVEEVSPEDDLELIAVISAAVAAYREQEGAPVSSDAYVVRSIKKVNKKNWRRA